jgi:hypothetical protein
LIDATPPAQPRAQQSIDLGAQIAGLGLQVIAIVDRDQVRPVVAEPRQAPVQLGQLVEVERVCAVGIAEFVPHRGQPRVHDLARIEQ